MDALLRAELGVSVAESQLRFLSHGGDRRSEEAKQDQVVGNNLKRSELGSTNAVYIKARLDRDARDPKLPETERQRIGEIYKRVLSGAYRFVQDLDPAR
jgi:hypothetical protein